MRGTGATLGAGACVCAGATATGADGRVVRPIFRTTAKDNEIRTSAAIPIPTARTFGFRQEISRRSGSSSSTAGFETLGTRGGGKMTGNGTLGALLAGALGTVSADGAP